MSRITLNDGRTLGYEEFGLLNGSPLFFFHGSPGSRFFHPPDEITKQLGIHLVCIDRPGYGQSTFQSGRSLLDWPNDISSLADKLGIECFSVAGHSGGGPYVLSCAYALPKRIAAGVVVSGAGPINSPYSTRGMNLKNRFGLLIGGVLPWPLWRLLIWIFYHSRAKDPSSAIDRASGKRPQADEELIHQPSIRETCIFSEVEAFKPGLRGLAWDTRLLTRPWGFNLGEIRIPIHLWHGTADDQAPISMAKNLAKQISSSSIHILENEAHLSIFPHWEEILGELIS
jgi:pimeloyl-ACP methyl ester carboxylesterase